MLDRWVFYTAFYELVLACVIDVVVIRMQVRTFRYRSSLQPLKKLLLWSLIGLILASLPLMFVYADTLWFHLTGTWIVYIAVLTNASAKILIGVMLYLIYKYN